MTVSRTVVIAPTMAMTTLAMAEMMAEMPRPIAETMDPCYVVLGGERVACTWICALYRPLYEREKWITINYTRLGLNTGLGSIPGLE